MTLSTPPRKGPAALHNSATVLLAGAAEGNYTLPAEVHAAHDAWRRLLERYQQVQQALAAVDRAALAQRLTAEALDAARSGDLAATRWTERIEQADRDERRLQFETNVLATATMHAAQEVGGILIDMADEVITQHLRPAMQEVLDAARAEAPRLEGVDFSYLHSLIGSPGERQKAFRRFEVLAHRYGKVREAQRHLMQLGEVRLDQFISVEIKNLRELYRGNGTDYWLGRHTSGWAPWPATGGSLSRLLWLATGAGGRSSVAPVPWMPTAEELLDADRRLIEEGKLLNPRTGQTGYVRELATG